MLSDHLATELERRAGAFLAAAQFASDASHLRAAALVGAAARVGRSHGPSGVEGYLAAIADLDADANRLAGQAIRGALDSAIVAAAADAWTGRRPAVAPLRGAA